MLNAAAKTIHISTFLFFNDPIGQEIADILIKKASDTNHPVKVRLLFDFRMLCLLNYARSRRREEMMQNIHFPGNGVDVTPIVIKLKNGKVEVYQTNIDYDKIVHTDNPKYAYDANKIRKSIKINALHVHHRKIIAIDGRIGYCGSAYIGAIQSCIVPQR